MILRPCRHTPTLVLRPADRPLWTPVITERAAQVEIYLGYDGDPIGTAQLVGKTQPGTTLRFDFTPDRDRSLRFYAVARAASGRPDAAQLRDAVQATLAMNRVTEAPAINQATDATHTLASVGVAASRYTRRMKIEVDTDSGFPAPEVTEVDVEDYRAAIPITRTGAGSGALTIYVRVSASGGNGYGPASDTQTVTFANNVGSGGTTGSGGYPPGAIIPVEHAE